MMLIRTKPQTNSRVLAIPHDKSRRLVNPAPVCALRNRQPPSPRPADRFLATFARLEDGGDSTTKNISSFTAPRDQSNPRHPTESSQLRGHQQTRTTPPLSLTPQKTHKHSAPSDHSPPRIPPSSNNPNPTFPLNPNPPHPHPHLLPLPFPLLPPQKPNRLPIPHRRRDC